MIYSVGGPFCQVAVRVLYPGVSLVWQESQFLGHGIFLPLLYMYVTYSIYHYVYSTQERANGQI